MAPTEFYMTLSYMLGTILGEETGKATLLPGIGCYRQVHEKLTGITEQKDN